MTTRLTEDDLKIRHTTLHILLAALGYVPDDSSPDTIWRVQQRVNKAVEEGKMAIDSRGHYRVTQEWKDEMVRRNREQPRDDQAEARRIVQRDMQRT